MIEKYKGHSIVSHGAGFFYVEIDSEVIVRYTLKELKSALDWHLHKLEFHQSIMDIVSEEEDGTS